MLASNIKRLSLRRDWYKSISAASLRADAVAGLTGAAVVLPQAVAFALIAGLPPEFGLFTAIIVTIVAALWGSSRVMVSGPTTANSALMFVTLVAFAEPGSSHYVTLALTLTFLVGLLQLAAGLAGLGGLIAFVSQSVIVGFTAAAALQIALSQLPDLAGVAVERSGGALDQLADLGRALPHSNGVALGIAAITLAILVLALRIDRRIPAYVLALAGGSLAAYLLDAPARGVAMFQPFTTLLPATTAPLVDLHLWGGLLPGAAAVAFVGLLQTISIGKSLAFRRGDAYDSNQEIIGQGLSNIAGSFLQCYAGSGSLTRSGINAESGAKTPLSAIFASLFLAASLVIVAPLVRFVPTPAMAAVILYVAWRLIDLSEIKQILRSERSEIVILLATFLTGVFSELDFAIFVGVLVSLSVFLNASAHPLVAHGTPGLLNGKRVFRNAETFALPICPQIRNIRIEGPLFFASVEHVEREFERIDRANPASTVKVLNLKGTGKIDLAGANFLITQARKIRARNGELILVAATKSTLSTLERLHVSEIVGAENISSHKSEAVTKAVGLADPEICKTCKARVFAECAAQPKDATPEQPHR